MGGSYYPCLAMKHRHGAAVRTTNYSTSLGWTKLSVTNRRNSKQTYANSAILRSCAQADCGDALRASEFLQNVDI